jgi:hypothetical protein
LLRAIGLQPILIFDFFERWLPLTPILNLKVFKNYYLLIFLPL